MATTITTSTLESILTAHNVTPAELALVSQNEDGSYTVGSRNPDRAGTEYRVEWNSQYSRFSCNCPSGNPPRDKWGMPLRPILPCWHKRAVAAHIEVKAAQERADRDAQERTMQAADDEFSREADVREAAAVALYGARAYEREDFSLLR